MNKRKKTLRQNNRLAHMATRLFDKHFCKDGLTRSQYKGIRLLGSRLRTEYISMILLQCEFATPDKVDALFHPRPCSDSFISTDKPIPPVKDEKHESA